jgi:hypothetical protein
MLRHALSLGLAGALLTGCANFTEEQCRRANWHSIGEQDALVHGLPPQINQISYQCQKVGVQVPQQAYMDGWLAGDGERTVRIKPQ